MFNNDNPYVNGEAVFYNSIKENIDVIFDVGCRKDSLFLDFQGEVHYFDPNKDAVKKLSEMGSQNRMSYFNFFALGDKNETKTYYPKEQSFVNRSNSVSDITFPIIKSADYITNKGLTGVDFLKIDTEGYEFSVMMGFEEYLREVKIIQFEYGMCYKDNNNMRLIDVINYLKDKGFEKFSYLTGNGYNLIPDFNDHYNYCNIVCFNKLYPI